MAGIRAVIRQPEPLRAVIKEVLTQQSGAPYTGPYTVTPRTGAETILPTGNRQLTGDIRVQKIPCYEVCNDAGGRTIYIAKEAE